MTNRRKFLGATAAVGAASVGPWFIRDLHAQTNTIRIGVPTAITGTWAALGAQVVRTCRLWAKDLNAKGGIDGRQIELVVEDTQGTPANCLRKAEEMVQKGRINLLLGVVVSSEALAVLPKLAEWNALFVSSINGAGSITAKDYVPNMFRANTSGPMGARSIALWLEDTPQKEFFSLSLDYAWGHSSVATFEKLITGAGKNAAGKVFAPTGTKDYSTYIARIRQANPQALYVALAGDDATAFFKQAGQYKLGEKIQIVTETVDLLNIKPVGDSSIGIVGSTRYTFSYDNPINNAFVKTFQAEYKEVPDTWDGEQWQACQFLEAAIRKAKSTETGALIKSLEGMELQTVKGRVVMRACDHQAEQQGFVVRVGKRDGFSHPVPEVLKTYPANRVTPGCRLDSY